MGHCFSCGSTQNDDLKKVIAQAKTQAVRRGETQAVYKSYGHFYFMSAEEANLKGYTILETVTSYE